MKAESNPEHRLQKPPVTLGHVMMVSIKKEGNSEDDDQSDKLNTEPCESVNMQGDTLSTDVPESCRESSQAEVHTCAGS